MMIKQTNLLNTEIYFYIKHFSWTSIKEYEYEELISPSYNARFF